jgi:hypothetical protein
MPVFVERRWQQWRRNWSGFYWDLQLRMMTSISYSTHLWVRVEEYAIPHRPDKLTPPYDIKGLTRAHIFLLAPSTFTCQGWIRQQSLESTESYFRDSEEHPIEKMYIEEQILPSTHLEETRIMNITIDEADDIDTRRLKRMQQRAQEKQALITRKSNKKRPPAGVLKSAKRQPLSASFVIQCGKEANEETRKPLPKDYSWYACKVVLKGFL